MVQWMAAIIKDTTSIWWPTRSIHSNWGWLFLNKVLLFVTVSCIDFFIVSNEEITTFFLALLFNTLVWVFFFSCNSIILNIVKTVGHQTSIASIVSIFSRTVNELLFRELNQFFSIKDKVDTFKISHSGKCVATTTETLVFDFWNCTFFSPIDRVAEFTVDNWAVVWLSWKKG